MTPPVDEQMAGRHEGDARAYLAAIVESSEDAILSKDLNGIIQSCNAAAERIFGYTAAELIGQPVLKLIPPERHQEEVEILSRIRRGERVEHFETVRVHKSGRRIDISLTVSAVRDSTGTIIGASKVARDITERKRAAAALAAQEAWFRVTLGSIGDGVIGSGLDGCVNYLNAAAETLTGWHAADAVGEPLDRVFQIVDELSRRTVESPAASVLRSGETVTLSNHTLLIARDGTERPIADSAAAIRDIEGRILGVVLVFRDVEDERRAASARQAAAAERERLLAAERAARADAERASRIKDDFLAMVSHELRTPLNAILGWTQLMSRTPGDLDLLRRGLEVVARNTRLQAQLVSDLLDVSRIVEGKLALEIHTLDLQMVVSDAIDTVEQEAAARGISLRRELDQSAAMIVAGDAARLQQVVWNLLSNAIKFTPRGGEVRVTVRTRDSEAEIVVSDTGAGIRPEVLPHVFDRFHQADRSITRRFGGLGLGLAIVKHLVELHGGRVYAESPGEGAGATFVVALPISVTPHGVVETMLAAAPDAKLDAVLEGVRVLVVEDEPDTRQFIKRLLESHGASVVAAASATEAIDAFRERRADVLISDIGLPGLDGYDLMRQIRREFSPDHRVAAIALTAYVRAEDRTRALRAGFQAHVTKPVDGAELVATVASLLELTGSESRSSRQY